MGHRCRSRIFILGVIIVKITKKNRISASTSPIMAADEDFTEDLEDTIDDLSDTADDLQDAVEEVEEDDVSIEVDNNIENHYIAVCDRCGGFFISAVEESDQEVESISGICPICGKDSEQYLEYVIKKA